MSNLVYASAKEAILAGNIDWFNDTVKAILVTEDYVFDATDEYLQSVPTASILATVELTNKQITDGKATADDAIALSVTGTKDITQVIIYQDTTDVQTSRLIAYIDTSTDLPMTPTGANQVITFDPNGIFSL